MMLIPHRNRPGSFVACLCLLLSVSAPSCVGRTKLTETEKAKLITEKRKEAEDYLAKFRASDNQNLASLEEYLKLHRETTEIAPSTCPRCWASYGEALSIKGWYHYYIYLDIQEELEKAKKGDAARLRAEAEQQKAEWTKYFTLSNQAFETHFRSPEVKFVHPYSFERVMRHYELMGNYDRALYYLDRVIESYPQLDPLNRQKFEKLRRLYHEERQRQKERGARLEESSGRRAAGTRAKGAQRPPPPPEDEDADQ